MSDRLRVDVGGLWLANPIIAGSGEHMIEAAGVSAALAAGSGAAVVKSANENPSAARQLGHTDYAMFDSSWRRLAWDESPPSDASLFNRSGLQPLGLDRWIEQTATLIADNEAPVLPSVIPGDLDSLPGLVQRIAAETECAGFELNIGAPHGAEAADGALSLERDEKRIGEIVAAVRGVLDVPLWVKITGQSDGVPQMASAAFSAGADAVTLITRHMAMLPDLETQSPTMGTVVAYGGGWALPITCRWLALTRQLVGPDKTLIGTHGARTGGDVARMLLAGATAVQMTSAVFTGGYRTLADAVVELDAYLESRGQTAADIVGRAADRLTGYTDQPFDADAWRRFIPDT